jgi:hypothetical protein
LWGRTALAATVRAMSDGLSSWSSGFSLRRLTVVVGVLTLGLLTSPVLRGKSSPAIHLNTQTQV